MVAIAPKPRSSSLPIKMMFNVSAKSLTLLLAIGVASTAGSKLRQRRTSLVNHGDPLDRQDDAASTTVAKGGNNLRSRPASASSASDDVAVAEQQQQQQREQPAPSLSAAKSIYSESDPITISLSVGSPRHPYFSSSDAPSLNLDYNYPKWSVGLFMRDADPQGGTLSPIVSINLCQAIEGGCETKENGRYGKFDEISVTFGDAEKYAMEGRWPVEVNDYGTGYDAYILDGKGAAAIGPLEFYIRNDDEGDVDVNRDVNNGPAVYDPTHTGHEAQAAAWTAAAEVNDAKEFTSHHNSQSGLMKYRKGTKKATERQHAAVSKATVGGITKKNAANKKIASANGLEVDGALMGEEPAAGGKSAMDAGPSKGSIKSDKEEYEADEAVTVNFKIDNSSDLSKYRIGLYMRMANPQGGALPPVVSLPLCSGNPCKYDRGIASGAVTFGSATKSLMEPENAMWPMDLVQWGTGFDAYVLDESGNDVLGPVKFNIMMSGTG